MEHSQELKTLKECIALVQPEGLQACAKDLKVIDAGSEKITRRQNKLSKPLMTALSAAQQSFDTVLDASAKAPRAALVRTFRAMVSDWDTSKGQ